MTPLFKKLNLGTATTIHVERATEQLASRAADGSFQHRPEEGRRAATPGLMRDRDAAG